MTVMSGGLGHNQFSPIFKTAILNLSPPLLMFLLSISSLYHSQHLISKIKNEHSLNALIVPSSIPILPYPTGVICELASLLLCSFHYPSALPALPKLNPNK